MNADQVRPGQLVCINYWMRYYADENCEENFRDGIPGIVLGESDDDSHAMHEVFHVMALHVDPKSPDVQKQKRSLSINTYHCTWLDPIDEMTFIIT